MKHLPVARTEIATPRPDGAALAVARAVVHPAPADARLRRAHRSAADGIIIPQPPRDRPIPWRDIPLAVKYHRVDVTIDDQVATTQVDQVFVNDANFAVEGTYIFPLPEDAAISSFDMWVDGQKLEGKLLGRDEARRHLRGHRAPADAIRRCWSMSGRGAFQASIFPIPPRRRAPHRADLHARCSPQQAGWSTTATRSTPRSSRPGRSPRWPSPSTWRTRRRSGPSTRPAIRCRWCARATGAATVSYEARNVRPDRDFDLYYSVSTDAIAVNLLSYKPFDEDGFFLLLVTPPDRGAR